MTTEPEHDYQSTPLPRRRRAWSIRVRGWLVALTAVPLIAATSLAASEIDSVFESRRDAASFSDGLDDLVQLSELQSRLLDERNWTIARLGVEEIGLNAPMVAAMTGVDLAASEEAAEVWVDAHLSDLGWSEIETELLALRQNPPASMDVVNMGYEELAGLAEKRFDNALEEMLVPGGQGRDGEYLMASFRVLEASSDARQSLTRQLVAFFGAQFDGYPESFSSLVSLAEQESNYLDAMDRVEQIAISDGEVHDALSVVQESPELVTFRAAVSEVIDNPQIVAESDGLDVSRIMQQLDGISAAFQSWNGAVDVHVALVEAAAIDAATKAHALEDSVAKSGMVGVGRIGVLVGAFLLFVVGLARALGRPLQRLAEGARNLRDGADVTVLKPSGPTEVREAMHALNEAAAHIHLAERQAHVLAQGDLHDKVLSEGAPGALGKSLQEAVRTLAGSLNEREEFRRRLSHEATHDGLTQLANRKATLAQLKQSLMTASRCGSTVAVLFVDLDNFKEVNDEHGHQVGDAVLWAFSKRLQGAIRGNDHVGRLGGDEFLVIAEPIDGATEAHSVARRIANAVSDPIEIGDRMITLSLSIGIAVADAASDLTASELLHDADLAVYRAKELGRSRIELCDEALLFEVQQRTIIEGSLRTAIAEDELTMHYQPIIDAKTAKLLSLEALIRWKAPYGAWIPPDLFIPIAERSDLILELDNWVVKHVVDQLVKWTNHPELGDVAVAVNISGRHLASESFVGDILGPLRDAKISPTRLVIEVTEGELLDDLDSAAHKLELLRNQSIRIAIDDFGTGYTSLGHLRSLPLDILKIDRTFIQDKSAESLVKLIIDIGRLLGAKVTSEGIETVDQAAHVTELGSDALQGYLFSKPMPAEVVEQMSVVAEPEHARL